MPLIPDNFFNPKVTIKKKFFARKRDREIETVSYFYRASSGLTALANILVALFFSPAVVVTNILPQIVFLMVANVFLALGYLYDFVSRTYHLEISWAEALFTTAGLLASIAVSVCFSPAVFFSSFSITTVLTCCSVIATAVNTFFLIKDVIVPPLKHIVESLFLYCGFNIKENYYSTKPLDNVNDLEFMAVLLKDETLQVCPSDILASYNNMLKKLDEYQGKYSEVVWGTILCQDKIKEVEKGQNDFRFGNDGTALRFLNKKKVNKYQKMMRLNRAIAALDVAYEAKDPQLLNQFGNTFFENFPEINGVSELKEAWKDGCKLLEDEVARQQHKYDVLAACIPRRMK